MPIPKDLAPGNYIIRTEQFSLHEGGRVGGPQIYVDCLDIKFFQNHFFFKNFSGKISSGLLKVYKFSLFSVQNASV